MESILLFFSLKYRGNWDLIYSALEQKEAVLKSEMTAAQTRVKSDYLTIIDTHFPAALKHCSNPPFVLFTYGNQDLLIHYEHTVGLINGEDYDANGQELSQTLVRDWIQKHCILLLGSDMALNEILLTFVAKHKGKLIMVLNQDLVGFQMQNRNLINQFEPNNLLIISEFYQDQDPNFDNQELYQRLIVALSRRLLFIEMKKRDPNLMIYDIAMREDKEVFCVPEPVNSIFDGSNLIIKRRGKLAETGDDVIPIPIYH